ncbi:MAG: TrkA C-terminal domain-containing protein [Acidobacteriota bacterium]
MLTIGLGHALGRARWRRLSPGPAGGTLFVALLIGQLGLQGTASEGVTPGDLGFALFIYAVGFDAAPHLQARFGQHPWRFLLVGTAVNLLAVGTLLPLARVFELSPEAAAGVLAGALTSAPTFAAASEVAADRSALSVSFALTYPLGLLSLVLAVQVLPRLLGEDLVRDSRSDEELVRAQEARSQRYLGGSPSVVRLHRVESEEVVGRPLRELHLTSRTGCVISLVQRGGRVELANADTLLELGDHVLAEGRVDELRVFEEVVGPE